MAQPQSSEVARDSKRPVWFWAGLLALFALGDCVYWIYSRFDVDIIRTGSYAGFDAESFQLNVAGPMAAKPDEETVAYDVTAGYLDVQLTLKKYSIAGKHGISN